MKQQIKFKKLLCSLNLHLEAASVIPNSNLGSILGPYGINIVSFCKDFNNKTQVYKGFIISVKLLIYSDKTYNLIIKSPTTKTLITKYLNLKKGSSTPNNKLKITLNKDILNEIIKLKYKDFPLLTLSKIKSIICSTAQTFGVFFNHNFIT
uniref:50S ribosomal protein L11 n=1 Tax=Nephromyces sp. ex Molgula occidentalis TaxID=2544991 RepID=A0A5C1H8D2_9APIC|nr:50S ribosomal protein L11 [Nephromyces sp. ex Molgula occidentalis]